MESHRRSVCVLAADLNGGDGGVGRGGGGGGVVHTIHGLCHLCIGCRLPQVCLSHWIQRSGGKVAHGVGRINLNSYKGREKDHISCC